jgi:transposase
MASPPWPSPHSRRLPDLLAVNGFFAALAGYARHRPETEAPAVTRWELAADLTTDVGQLEQRIAAVEARIKAPGAPVQHSLLELFGVGPVLAATFLGKVGDITGSRPSTTSPPHRHRPTGGLQQPGRPPSAVTGRGPQAESRPVHDGDRAGPPAQRRAGLLPAQAGRGKSPKEALRCLKRYIAREVYTHLTSPPPTVPTTCPK